MIPEEKWYTNLYERGNTGCASIFIMLDEFARMRELKEGEKIICMVPESGRFNSAYMQLTVVYE
jgi:3-oxoacyl-[acyl-carrier-protein] synthase-3